MVVVADERAFQPGINAIALTYDYALKPEYARLMTAVQHTSGKVVNRRIATSETWRDKQSGERKERTEWHSVAIFNEALGKIAEQYLRKGSTVYIEGQLETRKWQDQSGADRYSTEVVLRQFRGELTLLGGRDSGSETGGAQDERRGGYDDQSGGYRGGSSGGGGRSDMDDEIPF